MKLIHRFESDKADEHRLSSFPQSVDYKLAINAHKCQTRKRVLSLSRFSMCSGRPSSWAVLLIDAALSLIEVLSVQRFTLRRFVLGWFYCSCPGSAWNAPPTEKQDSTICNVFKKKLIILCTRPPWVEAVGNNIWVQHIQGCRSKSREMELLLKLGTFGDFANRTAIKLWNCYICKQSVVRYRITCNAFYCNRSKLSYRILR